MKFYGHLDFEKTGPYVDVRPPEPTWAPSLVRRLEQVEMLLALKFISKRQASMLRKLASE